MADSIIGGQVLRSGDDEPVPGTVAWSGSRIVNGEPSGPSLDARGAWVLPGIIDLHGDAFERSLMPRGGVWVDADVALADNDAQLLASGITTSFLSVTDGAEPGLRSRKTLRRLIAALDGRGEAPHIVLHVRHERCNTAGLDELTRWIETGVIRLLSFNDHAPSDVTKVADVSSFAIERSGVDRVTYERLAAEAVAQRGLGREQEVVLAAVAEDADCPMASHDRFDEDDLERDVELGVRIAEFPMSIPIAHEYVRSGFAVLFGAPNLVRGSSHLGLLSVRDAFADGVAAMLCSDYHYPSLFQAPFVLAELGLCSFGQAWAAVSELPAAAAGLEDRGRLEPGTKADILVVEPPLDEGPARVRTVVVDGRVVYEKR